MQNFKLIKTTYPYYWVKTTPNAIGNIFYIHGFADQPKMFWQKFVPEGNYNIYAIELPGHFETPVKDEKDLSQATFGQLCVNLIETLKLDHLIVIGHSMGGGIAMQVAAQLPEIVQKLVLISPANSHCITISSFWQLLFNFSPETIEQCRKFYNHLMYANNAPLFVRTLGGETIANFKAHKQTYKILKKNISSVSNLKNMLNNEKHIVCPTLLILGKHDGTISYTKTSKYLSKVIKDCTVKIFDKSGHFTYLEEPKEFNETVNDFINSK